MKTVILTAAILAVAVSSSAFASTVAEREYQRGYNDCLNGRYDQNQHGESYKKGCRAAEDGQQPSSPAAKHGAAPAKSASKAKLSDLKGMDAIEAFDVMTSRGFTSVDSLTEDDKIFGVYYNPSTHQCVQVTSENNRVLGAEELGNHPNCK